MREPNWPEVVRRQVVIGGWVVDEHTRKPVGGAVVKIEGVSPARQTKTRPNGVFYFMNLTDGEYKLIASIPGTGTRYGTREATVAVARETDRSLKVKPVTLSIPRTTIQGRVTAKGRDNAVFMAEVRIRGSKEQAFTDAKGKFVLAGVEKGARTFLIDAKNYQPLSETKTVNQGELNEFSFPLEEVKAAANGAQNARHRSRS